MKSFSSRQVEFFGIVGDHGEVLDVRSKIYILEDQKKYQLKIGNVILGGRCRGELDEYDKGTKIAFRARVSGLRLLGSYRNEVGVVQECCGSLSRICQIGRPQEPDVWR